VKSRVKENGVVPTCSPKQGNVEIQKDMGKPPQSMDNNGQQTERRHLIYNKNNKDIDNDKRR
jgi:hypothetical protein